MVPFCELAWYLLWSTLDSDLPHSTAALQYAAHTSQNERHAVSQSFAHDPGQTFLRFPCSSRRVFRVCVIRAILMPCLQKVSRSSSKAQPAFSAPRPDTSDEPQPSMPKMGEVQEEIAAPPVLVGYCSFVGLLHLTYFCASTTVLPVNILLVKLPQSTRVRVASQSMQGKKGTSRTFSQT